MFSRKLSSKLLDLSSQYPIVTLTGPRQSGKTTLLRAIFPEYSYVNLEFPDDRKFALTDPRNFLSSLGEKAIIDEAQYVPDLFSYIQGIVDEKKQPGQFILSGSQNFLQMESINQSLAGRAAVLNLLPLSLGEAQATQNKLSIEDLLFHGFYPRIYQENLSPRDWHPNYIQTYIERDVRQLKNIQDLNTFQLFLSMCAARTGQLLNLSNLANDCGITHNTAKAWISILETSFIVLLLRPHHKNFNKRLVKMPKLYFYDTGLACSLLQIPDAKSLATHHLRGALFESLIISDLAKQFVNKGLRPPLFFWRDNVGHEIDCLIDFKQRLTPIELKSGKTINDDYFKNLAYWQKLANHDAEESLVIYAGDKTEKRKYGNVLSWRKLAHDDWEIFA